MFAKQKTKSSRFSLLLLDEGELYVKDFIVACTWPAAVSGNWLGSPTVLGQLRVCTKSLFFEPDDVRIPVVRFPFAFLQQLEGSSGSKSIEIVAERWTCMKANNSDTPYVFEKGKVSAWSFQLKYASLADFMTDAQHMLIASRMPQSEQEEMLKVFTQQLEDGFSFDPGHLRNPATETIELDAPTLLTTPLVREACRIAITQTRLYLQPLHNIIGDMPVRSHPLALIAGVVRRRSSLQDVGLELFFLEPTTASVLAHSSTGDAKEYNKEPQEETSVHHHNQPLWGASSAFFSFRSNAEREKVAAVLLAQEQLGSELPKGKITATVCSSVLEANGDWLANITSAWQHGRLSNFDYLLYCNLAAGRSFNDLTQYPVFPWVLKDYTSEHLDLSDSSVYRDLSKPIGALNSSRLALFKERYEMMAAGEGGDEPPFLYGTHYSCPGYTLFWLVRAVPAHMLRLQNGRFDSPDRLFCNLKEAWDSVLSNQADVKELIPEFFMPGRSDFLLNQQHLTLGTRQNAKPVGDVELPPWAQGDAERFLSLHLAALESPFVSANLHHWIDLIFGVKSRGKAAEKADNVFRHTSYEGGIDVTTIVDPVQRAAVEVAINEFGQCPRQIFNSRHPRRLICPNAFNALLTRTSSDDVIHRGSGGVGVAKSDTGQALALALVSSIVAAGDVDRDEAAELEDVSVLEELDVLGPFEAELSEVEEGEEEEEEVVIYSEKQEIDTNNNTQIDATVANSSQPTAAQTAQTTATAAISAARSAASSLFTTFGKFAVARTSNQPENKTSGT